MSRQTCAECGRVTTSPRWRSPLTIDQEHLPFCSEGCERTYLAKHPDPVLPIQKAPPWCEVCRNTGSVWIVSENGDLAGMRPCTCEAARRARIPGGRTLQTDKAS